MSNLQAFVHETVCTIAQASGVTFETNDNPSIDDFTHDAFAILGEGGAMRLSDKHTCSECTQERKAVAYFLPAANDAAAVLGVDENQPVPQLDAAATEELQNLAESDDPMDVDTGNQPAMVNMVVIDGIVMGPSHCAFDNCTKPLTNACGKGVSFCQTHKREFHNRCRVRDCQNNKIDRTQACHEHCNDWHRYRQSQSKSSLAGV